MTQPSRRLHASCVQTKIQTTIPPQGRRRVKVAIDRGLTGARAHLTATRRAVLPQQWQQACCAHVLPRIVCSSLTPRSRPRDAWLRRASGNASGSGAGARAAAGVSLAVTLTRMVGAQPLPQSYQPSVRASPAPSTPCTQYASAASMRRAQHFLAVHRRRAGRGHGLTAWCRQLQTAGTSGMQFESKPHGPRIMERRPPWPTFQAQLSEVDTRTVARGCIPAR